MNTKMQFYHFIKRCRSSVGLSQTDLAKKVGVAISTISHIESGDYTRFPQKKVLLLASILKEDPEKFAALWIDAVLENQRESLKRKIFDSES